MKAEAETDDDIEEVAAKQMPKGPKGRGKRGEKMPQPVTLTAAQPERKKTRKEEETNVCFYSAGETHFGVRSAEDVMNCVMETHDIDHISVLVKAHNFARGSTTDPGHHGEHLGNLQALLEQEDFLKAKIDQVKHGLKVSGHFKKKVIRVLVCCSKGRHRSVTVAKVLQEVVARNGYNTEGPYHLSYDSWPNYLCYWCAKCKGHKKAKEAVFKKAALMW